MAVTANDHGWTRNVVRECPQTPTISGLTEFLIMKHNGTILNSTQEVGSQAFQTLTFDDQAILMWALLSGDCHNTVDNEVLDPEIYHRLHLRNEWILMPTKSIATPVATSPSSRRMSWVFYFPNLWIPVMPDDEMYVEATLVTLSPPGGAYGSWDTILGFRKTR